MKRKLSIGCVLLFAALALCTTSSLSSAEQIEDHLAAVPFTLTEANSSTVDGNGACEAPVLSNEAIKLGGPITIKASCTADCGSFPDVSCSASGSCTAVDRNCSAGQRGYVTCGSSTTYCPTCGCTEGATRYVTTSSCCCDYTIDWAPVNRRRLNKEKCINGTWVYQSFSCSGQNCGGNCPL